MFPTPLARAGAGLDQHHPAQGLHEHLRSRRPHRRRGLGAYETDAARERPQAVREGVRDRSREGRGLGDQTWHLQVGAAGGGPQPAGLPQGKATCVVLARPARHGRPARPVLDPRRPGRQQGGPGVRRGAAAQGDRGVLLGGRDAHLHRLRADRGLAAGDLQLAGRVQDRHGGAGAQGRAAAHRRAR